MSKNLGTDHDMEVRRECIKTMRAVKPESNPPRSHMILNRFDSIAPFANKNGFRERNRKTSYDVCCLSKPYTHDVLPEMIVIMNKMNTLGCDALVPGKHGCVYMSVLAPNVPAHKTFRLLVDTGEHTPKLVYMGEYRIATIHELSPDGWRDLPRDIKLSMATIFVGHHSLGRTAVSGVIRDYEGGSRRLLNVLLFCESFDMTFRDATVSLAMSMPWETTLKHPATQNPSKC